MSKSKVKFWLEDFKDIIKDVTLVPQNSQTFEQRFNSLTRLVIIIALLIIIFLGWKSGIIFMMSSLLIITCIYYGRTSIQENFELRNNSSYYKMDNKRLLSQIYQNVQQPTKYPPSSGQFCVPQQDLTLNQSQFSLNQALANGVTFVSDKNCAPTTYLTPQSGTKKLVNKNTLKAPIIAPPIADLESWRDNDFVNYSRINDQRIMDKYQSGYYVSECPCDTEEKLSQNIDPEFIKENYKSSYGFQGRYGKDNISQIIEPVARPYPYVEGVDLIEDEKYLQPGDVLTIAGYNPTNLKHNLPSNAAFGSCEKNDVFNQYNKDLYTQTLQPDVYSRSQIIEPISSNIGISFDQQFLPTTLEIQGNDWTYVEHDPRQYKPAMKARHFDEVEASNVYDPRYTGYGTSYRSYIDRITGQPRFYYDDVNAIRKPNYLTRNKLDTFDFGETYGPMKPHERMMRDDCNINAKAQEKFLNDSIGFRTDLQQSLMRKRNNEMWQLRKFPLSRAGQKNMSGGGGGARGANGGVN